MALKKTKGATLVESLTALAILTSVMAAAFTLYEKTIGHEQQVMRTRAKRLQVSAENLLAHPEQIPLLSTDFIQVNMQEQFFQGQNDVKYISITFSNKQGKTIAQRNYLHYQP